jgi:hypothetical protein
LPSVASDRRRVLACALALFALNVYIVRELFAVEYLRFMGSIEGAYISLARQLSEHWDLTWWPLWYAGIPYQNTYPPLLHWITALAARFTQGSPAHSYHFVTAFFYCAGPVTLFWMAYRLSGLVWPSFAGGLAYSLLSPSNFLSSVVRQDAGGWLHPRRLQALVVYGEGPHVTSMALLPVAIVVLDLALRRRRPVFYLLAAFGLASVVLTNWLGGFALATAVFAYIVSSNFPDLKRAFLSCAGLAAFAYALAARWIPPSTLAAIRTNAERVGGPYPIGVAQLSYAAVILVAILLMWLWFERRSTPAHLRFFSVFALLMSVVTLASAWWQIYIVPQPDRYHLEMEMALCPLACFALALPLGRLRRPPCLVIVVVLALLCYFPIRTYRRTARGWTRPLDIHSTSEYKTASWIDQNMHGRRVFVPGSDYFWLNAFTDTPQLEGGFDQGLTNPLLPVIHYQLYAGTGTANEGELGILWLKAFGVHAAAVCGPRSTEVYKPYHNWRKFEGLLPVLWRDGDDVIYRVLPDSVSLAHVLPPENRLTRPPASVFDTDFLRAYVAPLEDPALPPVEMTWQNRHHAVLAADLQKDQLLLVQVTYHPGWHARVNGAARPLSKDPIGLVLIAPQCAGRCVVDLEYGDDAEMLAASVISWTALAGGLLWAIAWPVRMRYWKHAPVDDY